MTCIKYIVILPFVAGLLSSASAQSQSFDDALDLYRQGQLEEALEQFNRLVENDERAVLYAGKSYLDLGEYLKAGYYLRRAAESETASLSKEALFTLALCEFRLKNFSRSLQILNSLGSEPDRTGIQTRSLRFYNDILEFLTDHQRFDLFWQTDDPGIRFDLVRSAVGRVDYPMLHSMMLEPEKLAELYENSSAVQDLRNEIGSEEEYSDPADQQFPAPEGMIYNVGVALPSFETTDPEFVISRNLYFGMTLAAEEFNARNSARKVFLRFKNTHSSPDSIPRIMNELVWNERIDAVVGPLFSETAEIMSQMAENYELPMLTPLANSDRINPGHNYTFQLNPTFSVHGKRMAEFAVRELNMDSLAVITELNSLGQISASAFRQEAERLGAKVIYHIEEDFASLGYDISNVTEIFTTDSILVDSLGYEPVDGIYAPFTGQAATTLVNLLMTDLEAMGTDVIVLGSEEWGGARYTDAQRRNYAIYHSRAYESETESETARFFEEDFTNRFGFEPDDFARIGYDAAAYLFGALGRAGNPDRLKQTLWQAPEFTGLAMKIHFDGSQVNQLVRIEALTEKARSTVNGDN